MSDKFNYGMGWLPDYPDHRDYNVNHEEIKPILKKINLNDDKNLPESIDLKAWCSPIEDQETIGSCTAQAAVGLLEYYEQKSFNKHIDASRLFLYKVTRNLMNITGDTGAFLRTTIGAMALFGVPPEKYWRYDVADFDKEPTSFCYSLAQNYQAIRYFRLDSPNTPNDQLLNQIKSFLSSGLPMMFGFTVFSSISQAISNGGKIPFPSDEGKARGGHAIVAIGYDDKIEITNSDSTEKTIGALLIRNSWGTAWGDNGYGWLPYKYIFEGITQDWWSLIENEWVDTGNFGTDNV